MLAIMVAVRCKFCSRVHCEAGYGSPVRFRCRKCKRLQTVTAGER